MWPPQLDCGTSRVVNKGEGTKGGSDGGEKQIAAERKTLDRLHEKKAQQEK